MQHRPHESLPYRPGLDGLRGVAVAGVVIYHVWPGLLPGGWLGVDLFFVLSGFLITSLLTTQWRRSGTISLLGFWTARARRLLPSLVAMLLTVTVVSYFWTLPSRRSAISWDVLSALFYAANWRMLSSDEQYFATDVGLPSPVRHTWSLAIEEQFYIVFPLIVVLLLTMSRRVGTTRRRHVLGGVFLVLALISAWRMHSLYIPNADPSRVYYGTDTRIFELLIGAAAGAWVGGREFRGRRRRRFDTVMGWGTWPALAALIASFVLLHDDESWLFPCGLVGLSLLCLVPILASAARRRSRAAQMLSWEPLRRLGLVSYSLYLWHWPVIVFLNGERVGLGTEPLGILQIGVSLLLAYASYRYLERPIRTGGLRALLPSTPPAGRLIGVVAVPAVIIGTVVVAQSAAALDGTTQAAGPSTAGGQPLEYTAGDYAPLSSSHSVTLIGNSIPESVDRTFPAAQYPDIDLSAAVNFGCDPFEGQVVADGRPQPTLIDCVTWRKKWPDTIGQKKSDLSVLFVPQTLVMDHRVDGATIKFGTSAYTQFVRSSLDSVRRKVTAQGGRRFAVVTLACHDMPFAKFSEELRAMNDTTRVTRTNNDVRTWARDHHVAVVDQYGFLCNGGYHPQINGSALYEDGMHFTSASGASFWTWFGPQLQRILK